MGSQEQKLFKSGGRRDGLSRQPVVMEKDRHVFGIESGSSVQVEENSGGLPAGGEWKTICSLETLVKKGLDGDEEQQATHQKLSNEPMSGPCQAIEFGLNLPMYNQIGSPSLVAEGKASNATQSATNLLQGTKPCLEKNKRNVGHSPLKELPDYNACSFPGISFDSGSCDLTDDDDKQILKAANYARSAKHRACSSSFWETIEPIFASVTLDDTTYLHKQLSLADSDDTDYLNFADEHDVLGDEQALPQTIVSGERQENQLNVLDVDGLDAVLDSMDQSQEIDTSFGKLDSGRGFENAISLPQLLLSAFIEEVDTEGPDDDSEMKNETFQSENEHYHSSENIHTSVKSNEGDMMESEADKSSRLPYFRNPLYNGKLWQKSDGLIPSEVKVTFQSGQNNGDISSFDSQYQNLSFEDRYLLELQSIGINHEKPLVEETKEEDIDKDINELRKKLHEQVEEKNKHLSKLKKILPAREAGGWHLEQIALDGLVEMAFKKCKACSRRKATKAFKQRAIHFAERTIVRCRKYEATGKSCFSEPGPYDVISSVPQCNNVANLAENIGAQVAANMDIDKAKYK